MEKWVFSQFSVYFFSSHLSKLFNHKEKKEASTWVDSVQPTVSTDVSIWLIPFRVKGHIFASISTNVLYFIEFF